MKKETERNIDTLKKMDAPELARFLHKIKSETIFCFVDYEKWLDSPCDTDIFDLVTGEKGMYHDRNNDRECLVVERKMIYNEKYAKILVKNMENPMHPALLTVPEYLVQTKAS